MLGAVEEAAVHVLDDEEPEPTHLAPYWDQDGVHEIYRAWRAVLESYGAPDRILCAEAWVEPQERAPLLDALWQLDPTQDTAREAAADLYRQLYQQGPSIRYREAYARLTGATLPPGTPLPPLPDALQEDAGELDELLRQVDEVSLQLSAT